MKELIFWFDQPPKVGKGCFNRLTKTWPDKVVYAYLNGFNDTRRTVNWDDGEYGNAEVLTLGEDTGTADRIRAVFEKYPDAVYVLCGLKSKIMTYLDSYIKSGKYRLICFAERPGVYGKWWKRLLKRIYIPLSERRLARVYGSYISAYLPLGMTGVRTYAKYGWPSEKLFPFMYDPVDYLESDGSVVPVHEPLRFLYVGRFSRYTKGTDTLKMAFDRVEDLSDRFTLSVVGGYGDMREELLKWIGQSPRREFLGKWDSTEVSRKMKDYDVCVVPSKFDGWNLLVNEAVRAHIGVIVTDEAVSDEVIDSSGSGLVVKAKSPVLLADALRTAITTPGLVGKWKERAKTFCPYISNATVADYFTRVVDYTFEKKDQKERPECPWIKALN